MAKSSGSGVDQLDPDALVDHHPGPAAARSASPSAAATQVAPVPATSGRSEPASPPPAVAGYRTPFDQVEGERPAVRHEHGVGQRPVPLGMDPVGGHAIDATRLGSAIQQPWPSP